MINSETARSPKGEGEIETGKGRYVWIHVICVATMSVYSTWVCMHGYYMHGYHARMHPWIYACACVATKRKITSDRKIETDV